MSAKDLTHLLSDEAKRRKESPLKAVIKYRSIAGIRSLAGGLPLPVLFPFDNMHTQSPAYPFDKGVAMPNFADGAPTLDVHIDRNLNGAHTNGDIDFSESLQYSSSQGNPHVLDFVKEHTKIVHNPPYADWDIVMSIGNTFAWDCVLRTFVNPGEVVLVEEFAFTSALEAARSVGAVAVGVEMDLYGIIPEKLDEQLAAWQGPRPKVLYTVPTGQNPTGSSLSAERRKAIYALACKYDFVIVEDEPYYYLQFPKYVKGAPTVKAEPSVDAEKYVKSLDVSFLSLDVEGRVLRLDSFSKVIAPGTRMSYIVAQKTIVERLVRLHEVTAQNVCGFSTSVVYGLLRRWGQQGYLSWLSNLGAVYAQKRDLACDAIYNNFPAGAYEFEPPVAGMFFWFKLDARKFKYFEECGRSAVECENKIIDLCIQHKIVLVPGHWFITRPSNSTADEHAMYIRGTFAGVSDEVLKGALEEFGVILHENFN